MAGGTAAQQPAARAGLDHPRPGARLVEGVLRGLSVHTALCIPAGTLFALEMGKQGFGTVCTVPAGGPVLMPDEPMLLRIRDVQAQAELTAILEGMSASRTMTVFSWTRRSTPMPRC